MQAIKNAKGFSLAELLLAAAILALLSSMLLQTAISSFILNQTNRNSSIAIIHAQYAMEEIKGTNFDNIKPDIDSGSWNWSSTDISGKGLSPLPGETISTQETGTSLLNVMVTVNWEDKTGRNRNVSLQTYFAQPP
ncbi:MAG: prepilin-type N-terminal cleavage/methylation domain-containing protein [Candidatus Omnitrophica bacterium]|nr:prepilin-type N-terminal cleavage/methylation domain-containing protein [Candidatus Omnitrophota bacterium]